MPLQDVPQEELEPQTLPDLPLQLSKFIPETKELYTIFQCSVCYEVRISLWYFTLTETSFSAYLGNQHKEPWIVRLIGSMILKTCILKHSLVL